MPYVIKFNDDTYLHRPVNSPGLGRKRSRTKDLSRATVWAKIGHAKTAFIAAVENKDIRPTERVQFIEVVYRPVVDIRAPWYTTRPRRSGKYITGREMVEVRP